MWNNLTRLSAHESAVSLEETKRHLNIDYDEDDEIIELYINAAEAFIVGPNGIGVALTSTQWRLSLDHVPSKIKIPLWPIRSIDSVAINGDTLDPTLFGFDTDVRPLVIVHNGPWPSVPLKPGVLKVEFTAGWADPSEVPGDLRAAILLLVGHLHRNREAASEVALKEIPFGVQSILDRYRPTGLG